MADRLTTLVIPDAFDIPPTFVIPAKAGTQTTLSDGAASDWTPAFAGVTKFGAGVTKMTAGRPTPGACLTTARAALYNMGNDRG